jgi:hypothetical protein
MVEHPGSIESDHIRIHQLWTTTTTENQKSLCCCSFDADSPKGFFFFFFEGGLLGSIIQCAGADFLEVNWQRTFFFVA